jgi:hypothetical protein
VGIFTSSQDEFAALGPEWHLDDWGDQWRAYDHVLTRLEPLGYSFYLRVHPNFITKSHASFLREREQLLALQRDHPKVKIFWHDEQVNSYALMAQTDVAIVWDSTVGLEASGRGVPVWELAASYYDLYADVHQWFGPADDPSESGLEFEVDVARSQRFMAYLAKRDQALPADAIAVRESLVPPATLGRRIAAAATSGGAPTVTVALGSIVDSARHRRLSINGKAARAFVSR